MGSFASISTLFGNPLLGAFLLMEASGLGGPMLGLVLLPGLLAAGIGTLIFVGLDSWTGLGTFSLAIPGLPPFGHPNIGEFGWALVIGVAAALVGTGIRWLGRLLHPYAERWILLAVPLAGLAVAGGAAGACCPQAASTGMAAAVSRPARMSARREMRALAAISSTSSCLCLAPGLPGLPGLQ